jgi:enoyl-CoA hydratase
MALVRTEVRDRVAVITLDDPDRRNAVSLAMNAELRTVVAELDDRDDVGAIVVTGEGRAFCAGADLGELRASADAEGLGEIYAGFLAIAHARTPTIAAVNGPAVGAGMNMALACDLVVAGRSARFDSRFLQIGIHPGGGHTWRLARLAGAQTALAMVVFGEVLDGEAAARHGLAWRCVDDQELLATALALAGRAAAQPPVLTRRAKATIGTLARVADSDAAVAHELDAQVWSMGQPEFHAMIDAMARRISSGT